MGQDYNPHIKPDTSHWAKCTCTKYAVRGNSSEEVLDMINKHFNDNKDTHTIGRFNGYILHIPEKAKWYRKIFGVHKGSDN